MNKESCVWVGSLLQKIYLEIGRTRTPNDEIFLYITYLVVFMLEAQFRFCVKMFRMFTHFSLIAKMSTFCLNGGGIKNQNPINFLLFPFAGEKSVEQKCNISKAFKDCTVASSRCIAEFNKF